MAKDLEFVRTVLGLFDWFPGHMAPSGLSWRIDGERAPVTFFVNCNDLFWWGTADCEEVTPENVERLAKALEDVKAVMGEDEACHVTDLFAARARKMRPQGACYVHIPPALWPLFDACGPARETGLGNPKPQPVVPPAAPVEAVT